MLNLEQNRNTNYQTEAIGLTKEFLVWNNYLFYDPNTLLKSNLLLESKYKVYIPNTNLLMNTITPYLQVNKRDKKFV